MISVSGQWAACSVRLVFSAVSTVGSQRSLTVTHFWAYRHSVRIWLATGGADPVVLSGHTGPVLGVGRQH